MCERAVVDAAHAAAVTRVRARRQRRRAAKGVRRKGAEGVSLRQRLRHHPRCAAQALPSSRPRHISVLTRLVSWLEPESSGAHPRTKGTQCFTGGCRHRLPSTPKGLRATRCGEWQGDPPKFDERVRRHERRCHRLRISRLRAPRKGTCTPLQKGARAGRSWTTPAERRASLRDTARRAR